MGKRQCFLRHWRCGEDPLELKEKELRPGVLIHTPVLGNNLAWSSDTVFAFTILQHDHTHRTTPASSRPDEGMIGAM